MIFYIKGKIRPRKQKKVWVRAWYGLIYVFLKNYFNHSVKVRLRGASTRNRDTSKEFFEVVQVTNIYGYKWDYNRRGDKSQILDVFFR